MLYANSHAIKTALVNLNIAAPPTTAATHMQQQSQQLQQQQQWPQGATLPSALTLAFLQQQQQAAAAAAHQHQAAAVVPPANVDASLVAELHRLLELRVHQHQLQTAAAAMKAAESVAPSTSSATPLTPDHVADVAVSKQFAMGAGSASMPAEPVSQDCLAIMVTT